MTPNLSTVIETSSNAVGPTEAASYLDISIDGWQQMLADGVVPAIPGMPGYVRRSDLRAFRIASDAIVSNVLIRQAEVGHEDEADLEPDVIPIVPTDDGDWIKALLALATTSAYRTGWKLGFGAGLGTGAIVSALIFILAAWLRGH